MCVAIDQAYNRNSSRMFRAVNNTNGVRGTEAKPRHGEVCDVATQFYKDRRYEPVASIGAVLYTLHVEEQECVKGGTEKYETETAGPEGGSLPGGGNARRRVQVYRGGPEAVAEEL